MRFPFFLTLIVLLRPTQFCFADPPKLVVLVVIDQFRSDYLERFKPHFNNGFKILTERSSVFKKARYYHVPTETAPGHATLATGTPPSVHGIIGNDWLDKTLNVETLSITNEKKEKGPFQLRAETLGDILKKKTPASKVISISLKDRSAILMGGQKADTTIWFDNNEKKFVTSAFYPQKTSAWLEAFNSAVLPRFIRPFWTSVHIKKFLASPEADQMLQQLIIKTLQETSVGLDEHTDLLCLSYSALDYVGHIYGPDSQRATQQMIHLDKMLGELLGLIRKQVGEEFIFAFSSDHGVTPVPESPQGKNLGAKRILANRFKQQLERIAQNVAPEAESAWIIDVNFPNIDLNQTLLEKQAADKSVFLKKMATAFSTHHDVAAVYLNSDLSLQNPRDEWESIYKRSLFSGRSADLLIRFKPGVVFTRWRSGTTHGSPYDIDSFVPIILYGHTIPVQTIESTVGVEQLAPTLAHMMGFSLPASTAASLLP